MYVYQIDSKVRINRPQDDYWHGKTGTVVGHGKYNETYMLRIDGETDVAWFLESQIVPDDLTNITHIDPPSSDEVIADLTDQLYDTSKELDRYKKMYFTDMAHWENTMRDVKDRENWCDEGTNKIIGELNQGFIGWQLDYYEQDFEIEVEIRATIVTTTRVMVSATSEEAAHESVLDDPEAYFSPTSELADAAQYVDDYEVDIA